FMALGTFGHDAMLDLAVTNLQGGVSVLLGDGRGSFDAAGSYATGIIPSCIAVADLDRDGSADLVVANQGTYPFHNSNLTVLLGNGDGTFQPASPLDAGSVPTAVAVGDFNGDGIPDLAVANYVEQGTVNVLLGNGDGSFQPPNPLPVGNGPRALA